MRLQLFELVDQSTEMLRMKQPTFQYVEKKVVEVFRRILSDKDVDSIAFTSRIKSAKSLKEKMIRNKYYLECHTPEDVFLMLPDLIGVTVECRFISDENKIYQQLLGHFKPYVQGYAQCIEDDQLFLNLNMPQPQTQRNGFTLYRIDGYYLFGDERVNFEFQIKALVHRFWSEIEHQVVYKNPHIIFNDRFMKSVLSSIHDNLEVVDHQLQIVYEQMLVQSAENSDFGMSEQGFKSFLAKSINDLYSIKMVESLGFTTDFKKCSAILSQYIYIKDFLNSENPHYRMIEYFEHFNLLKISNLDFTQPIYLEKQFYHSDPFCDELGRYWQSILNEDYEWHVFFVMLFAVEPGNNLEDFHLFLEILRNLVVENRWYETVFSECSALVGQMAKDALVHCIAKCMIKSGKIDFIYEEKLIRVMEVFRKHVDALSSFCSDDEQLEKLLPDSLKHLERKLDAIFSS
ncbi:MAG: RelA/spoT family protein [Erysipelotrichaceae bacterium]|nr:RelA/spoT family protein [Erysipelotrichaceae bacterium]